MTRWMKAALLLFLLQQLASPVSAQKTIPDPLVKSWLKIMEKRICSRTYETGSNSDRFSRLERYCLGHSYERESDTVRLARLDNYLQGGKDPAAILNQNLNPNQNTGEPPNNNTPAPNINPALTQPAALGRNTDSRSLLGSWVLLFDPPYCGDADGQLEIPIYISITSFLEHRFSGKAEFANMTNKNAPHSLNVQGTYSGYSIELNITAQPTRTNPMREYLTIRGGFDHDGLRVVGSVISADSLIPVSGSFKLIPDERPATR